MVDKLSIMVWEIGSQVAQELRDSYLSPPILFLKIEVYIQHFSGCQKFLPLPTVKNIFYSIISTYVCL